jgi:HD-like signal output (HDOD) protein
MAIGGCLGEASLTKTAKEVSRSDDDDELAMSSTPTKTRVLFVDDEPHILQVIKLAMDPLQEEWETAYATDALHALAVMEKQPFDVVVSDMQMPRMNGAQFFSEVQRRWPHTIRIILSGYVEPPFAMTAVATAHRFLTKPFVLGEFLATLSGIQQLNHWVMNDRLRSLVAKLSHLPSIPLVYFSLTEALQQPEVHASRIAGIVATDPALMAKMLQIVNSAFFGYARPISNPMEAVVLLGANTVRSLAMTADVFSMFEARQLVALPVRAVCDRALRAGILAMKLARMEHQPQSLLDQAFTAGALQNIGQLIFATNMPTEYAPLYRSARSAQHLLDEERRAFGASHADVGAYLLGVWGLPVPLVEAVAYHHEPSRSKDTRFTPLTAVHAAIGLLQEEGFPVKEGAMDMAYLNRLGLQKRLPNWRDCFTPAQP